MAATAARPSACRRIRAARSRTSSCSAARSSLILGRASHTSSLVRQMRVRLGQAEFNARGILLHSRSGSAVPSRSAMASQARCSRSAARAGRSSRGSGDPPRDRGARERRTLALPLEHAAAHAARGDGEGGVAPTPGSRRRSRTQVVRKKRRGASFTHIRGVEHAMAVRQSVGKDVSLHARWIAATSAPRPSVGSKCALVMVPKCLGQKAPVSQTADSDFTM